MDDKTVSEINALAGIRYEILRIIANVLLMLGYANAAPQRLLPAFQKLVVDYKMTLAREAALLVVLNAVIEATKEPLVKQIAQQGVQQYGEVSTQLFDQYSKMAHEKTQLENQVRDLQVRLVRAEGRRKTRMEASDNWRERAEQAEAKLVANGIEF